MMDQQSESEILDYFVLKEPRTKQITAVEYIERKYDEGIDDIVIAAPTGIGKSGIGATACIWGQKLTFEEFQPGGYYLVTQKLLQDQLASDFKGYVIDEPQRKCRSIKSSSEYTCDLHGTCGMGIGRKPRCHKVDRGDCTYYKHRRLWQAAMLSVTNYPYLFTEHWAVGNLPPRNILVLDECHTLERQILGFVEVSLSHSILQRWTPTIKCLPDFEDINHFADFLYRTYLPVLIKRLQVEQDLEAMANNDDDKKKRSKERIELENYVGRISRGVKLITEDPENWVFWVEENRKGDMEAQAKPLDASPFSEDLCFEMGKVRIHMSAYPGSKRIYCDSLGLDPDRVAWLNLNSTFPIANRGIYLSLVGSMSKRNRQQTLPDMIEVLNKLLESYSTTKGIIHCNSYELGTAIYNGLRGRPEGKRIIFPQNSDDRTPAFEQHRNSKHGTVLLSPSMSEGFDFAYDLARWQAIVKVPYPYLGDRQVAAKKDLSQSWYDLEAVKSIIQACGRIVRSDTDVGDTYILDSDFLQLWEKCADMFPRWWTDALVWPKKG